MTATDGRYAGHFVIPFIAKGATPHRTSSFRTTGSRAIQRRFSPCGEWQYVKVYGGTSLTELLLRDIIGPLLVAHDGDVIKWFFLHYADPRAHLRVRWQKSQESSAAVLIELDRVLQDALNARRIGTVQYDTYVREVERYGGAQAIEHAETAFHADSCCALALLRDYEPEEWRSKRLLIGLRSVDRMCADLGWSVEQRLAIYRELDMVPNKDEREITSALFRELRPSIDAFLNENSATLGGDANVAYAIDERGGRLRALRTSWLTAVDSHLEFARITKSLLHLNVNRLALGLEERRMYGLLRKATESRVARHAVKARAG